MNAVRSNPFTGQLMRLTVLRMAFVVASTKNDRPYKPLMIANT
jgi:hypothetical protein